MKTQDKMPQQKANSSAHNVSSKALQKKAVGVIQKAEPEEEVQQHQSKEAVQKMDAPALDEEHPAGLVQSKQKPGISVQLKENNTGMPDNLKSGIENLSGMRMDHVKVHYNSVQPAQLNALAYAQGNDIHIAPGQEEHLPHEAWHVVQQAQGRVKPTMQMKDIVPVNDDERLEHEADVMGAKANSFSVSQMRTAGPLQKVTQHAAITKQDALKAVPNNWNERPLNVIQTWDPDFSETNCHGYTVYERMGHALDPMAFIGAVAGKENVAVFTKGNVIAHSGIYGKGRLMHFLIDIGILQSIIDANDLMEYDRRFSLPAELEGLKKTIGYREEIPEETFTWLIERINHNARYVPKEDHDKWAERLTQIKEMTCSRENIATLTNWHDELL